MKENKGYIFISYSRKDLPKIRPIIKEMRKSGYHVWFDKKIPAGVNWSNYIASHIENCTACVAFHSQKSRDSRHCQEEIHYALKYGKTVFSVYLDDNVKLEGGLAMQLARFQSIRYTNSAKLLEALQQNRDFKRCGPNAPKKRKGVDVKKVVKPLLVAVFLLIAVFALLGFYKKQPPLWHLDENGVLDIIGLPLSAGEITNYSYSQDSDFLPPPWANKTQLIQFAVIRKGVTHIGASSFQNCSNIKFAAISEGVISTGTEAFSGCTTLQEIHFPNSLEALGERAFKNCTGLKEIYIPWKVKTLRSGVFFDCTGLERVDRNGVEDIESYAFSGCTALKQFQFSEYIRRISYSAFADCIALEEITIPNHIRVIYPHAFSGCSNLKAIHIQFDAEKVQRIEDEDWFLSWPRGADPDTLYISTVAFGPNTKIIYDPLSENVDVS